MASLKDMRVRIAATKATQKITKAMQMVAASKLRRAQAAAEAARPYAERMERVIGNANAADIGNKVVAMFGRGEFDVATLFYSRFKSVISQIPTAQQIIPPKLAAQAESGPTAAYEYEPDEEEILA